MGVIHSYYRILGISSSANLTAIKRAVKNMKDKDSNGDFTATLNMIEQILHDPVQREQYDDSIDLPPSERADYRAQELEIFNEQKKNSAKAASISADFLDVPEIDVRRYRQQTRMDDIRNSDNQESLVAELEERNLKYPFVFPWKKVFLITIIIGLSCLAYFGAKPLYFEYQTYKQADDALNDLFSARDMVIDYIRKNKVFPKDLSTFSPHRNSYHIVLVKDNAIQLTFNDRAAKKLQGGSYMLETYQIPNMGINWRCSIDNIFPEEYKPPRCF